MSEPVNPADRPKIGPPADFSVISDKNALLNMFFMCILIHMIIHIKGAQYENDIEYSG
jgi:hypothetical protein